MQKSLGQRLSTARKQKKLSLDSISEEIYIRKEFLELMEADHFDLLPSAVQARGFLRLYADFLKLDTKTLLSQLVPLDVQEPPTLDEAKVATSAEIKTGEDREHFFSKGRAAFLNLVAKFPLLFKKKENPISGSPKLTIEVEDNINSRGPDEVFKEIGLEIRKNREILGLTLDDLEMATSIKKSHLEWIENGTLDDFSSPIQARGLLQNYVKYMGMDLDAIMLRYANALLSSRQDTATKQNRKSRNGEKKNRIITVLQFLSPNLLIAIFLISSMVCLLAWGINRISSNAFAKVTISAPPISEILMATQESTQVVISIGEATEIALTEQSIFLSPAPIETEIANNTPGTPTPSGQMIMNISVNQRTYLLVIIDGIEKVNGRVKVGDIFQFSANQSIELAAGSAAAISVVYGQNDLGIMGNPGEAIHLVFTENGAFTPTPRASSTPTPTRVATQTPSPTKTIPAPTITPLIP